jgi:hypothetical protein
MQLDLSPLNSRAHSPLHCYCLIPFHPSRHPPKTCSNAFTSASPRCSCAYLASFLCGLAGSSLLLYLSIRSRIGPNRYATKKPHDQITADPHSMTRLSLLTSPQVVGSFALQASP